MIVFPFSKINLGLSVIEKRPDGYHNIESLFYPVNLTDILEICVSDDKKTHFVITGYPISGSHNENLCLRAFELLKRDHQIPHLNIHLHKNIPAGAGLGGGSSDAAFTLMAINKLCKLHLPSSILSEYALMIGSDCPFFIRGKPAIATGRGEQLSEVDLLMDNYNIVIVKPDLSISTADAYHGITPRLTERSLHDKIKNPVDKWMGLIRNDFENSIFEKYPEIRKIKTRLMEAGAIYTSMTGTGSAVYAIFSKNFHPDLSFHECFVWSGSFKSF